MKDFYQFIILSFENILIENVDYLQIESPVTLLNETTLLYQDKEISFDYLVFSNTNLISNFLETNILHENKLPITNFFHATSVENIYFNQNVLQIINDIISDNF